MAFRVLRLLLFFLPLHALAAPSDAPVALSQQDVVRQFTSEDGLPQNSVNTMVQDRAGYLWLGTFGGLVRFDGSRFTVFSGDRGGPPSNRILVLWLDGRERLWIGTENAGLALMDEAGQFIALPLCGGTCEVRQLAAIGTDIVVAHTDVGVFRIDVETRQATRIEEAFVRVVRVEAGPDGRAYVGDDAGLWVLDAGGATRLDYPAARGSDQLHALAVLDGEVWAVFHSGVFRYSPTTGQWRHASLGALPSGTPKLWRDMHGQLWLNATNGATYRVDGQGRLEPVPERDFGRVESVLTDRAGTIWLGGAERGLFRIRPARVALLNDATQGFHLPGLPVVGDGRGGQWFGLACDGLRHRTADGRIRAVSLALNDSTGCPWSIHVGADGALWVGTADGYLVVLDPHGQVLAQTQVVQMMPVRAIHPAGEGRHWVAGGRSVFLARRTGDRIELEATPVLEGQVVNHIAQARAGGVWMTGNEGALRLHEGRIVERWGLAQGLSSRFVRALLEDEGGLWLGTYGGGLNYIADGVVHRYREANGLFDDVVSCLLVDARGRLWMGGNRGIAVLRPDQLTRARTGEPPEGIGLAAADGLVPSETNGGAQPACHRDEEGRLWFPLLRGYARIDPENVLRTGMQPLLPVIDSVSIAGQRQSVAGALRLVPGARNLEIGFAAPSLDAPEQVRYRFRLDSDSEWTNAGRRSSVLYPIVPWGEHVFEVEARNADGVWSSEPARLRISHPRPLYLSPWVWGVAAFLAPLVLFAAWRIVSRTVGRRRREREALLVRARTHELESRNRDLVAQARLDPKTGIANHLHLMETLEVQSRQCADAGLPLSLLLIDIDNFKRYNDHFGHLAGDDSLVRVVQTMRTRARSTDLLARFGGEEFVLLMPEAGAETAARMGERLRQQVMALGIEHAPDATYPILTISVGHATQTPSAHVSGDALLAAADRAMYRAKRNGRNRVEGEPEVG